VFKSTVKVAEKEMYKQVTAAVEAGQDIVWDQTNLNKKTRAKKLDMIPDHYRKIAVFFPEPDDLEQRLSSRPGKTIPANIIQSMRTNLEKPDLEEGFSVVTVANNK
jgi:predicted kinase